MAAIAIRNFSLIILRGLPPSRPLALAAASPALVLSRMRSASNSASAAKMPKTNRPLDVVVSIWAPVLAKTLKSIFR